MIGNSYTLTAWYENSTSSSSWPTLWRGLGESVPNGDHMVIVAQNTNNLGLYANGSGGGGFTPATLSGGTAQLPGGVSTTNTWYFIAVVDNNGHQSFYTNNGGSLQLMGTLSNNMQANQVIAALGNIQSGGQRFANGIDDAYVYNTAVSTAGLTAIMAGGSTPGALPVGAPVTIASGATLDLNGGVQTIASLNDYATGSSFGTVTNSNAIPAALTISSTGGAATFTGSIRNGVGGVNLNITGSGTQVLAGAGAVSVTTTVSGGTLQLSNQNALQNGTLAPAGGVVAFDKLVSGHAFNVGGLGGSGGMVLQDTAANPVALSVGGNGASSTFSGALSGPGSLTKTGSGTQSLAGSNAYTGATVITSGTLSLSPGLSMAPAANPTIWLNAQTLSGANGSAITTWNDSSGNGYNFTGNATLATLSNGINGLSAVHFNGSLTLSNTAINLSSTPCTIFYIGEMTATSGAGWLLSSYYEGSPGNNWLLGYWGGNMNQAYFNGWVYNPSTPANTSARIYGAQIGGSGVNSTVWVDTGGNSYTQLASNTSGTQGPNTLCLGGAHGAEDSQGNIGELLVYSSTLSPAALAQTETYLNDKWFGGGGSFLPATSPVTIASGAALDLNGALQQTILSLNDYVTGSSFGTVTNSNTGAAALTISPTGGTTATFSGLIQNGVGGVSLVMAGSGTQVLAGANTFSGLTTVSGGTLDIVNQYALQNSTLTPAGGTVIFDQSVSGHAFPIGGLAGSANLALTDNGGNALALTVGGNNQSTNYSGVLTGGSAASLTKVGSGALTLSNSANTFSFPTTINGGQLVLQYTNTATSTSVYASPVTVNSGGMLTLQTNPTTTFNYYATVTLASGGALQNSNATNWTIDNAPVTVSGATTISQSAATVTSGKAGLFLDSGLFGSGTCTINNVGSTGTGVNLRNNNSTFVGTLVVNGVASTANNGFGGSGLGVGGSPTALQNVDIVVNGSMELGNNGIGWANGGGYPGGSFNMGALSGSGDVESNSGASGTFTTFIVGNTGRNATFSGTIVNGSNDTMSLVKAGAGMQVLSGSNPYSGGTLVSGGTLALAAASALSGGGAVTVNSAATLALSGPGAISGAGAVTVNAGGVLATLPGGTSNSIAGPASVNGTLAPAYNSPLAFSNTAGLTLGNNATFGLTASGGTWSTANVTAGNLAAASSNGYTLNVIPLDTSTLTPSGSYSFLTFSGTGPAAGTLSNWTVASPNIAAWAGGTDNNWTTTANWSGQQLAGSVVATANALQLQDVSTLSYSSTGPTSLANVVIQLPGGAAVTGPALPTTVAGLTLGSASGSTNQLSLGAGALTVTGTATVGATGYLNVGSGTLTAATANFSAGYPLGGGTVNAANPVTVTNTLMLPGGLAATLVGGGSFTAGGANLANNSSAATLTVSGGTLALTSSVLGPSASVALTNPSFELPVYNDNTYHYVSIPGWTGGSGVADGTSTTFNPTAPPNYNATTNRQWAFMQGVQTLSQTFVSQRRPIHGFVCRRGPPGLHPAPGAGASQRRQYLAGHHSLEKRLEHLQLPGDPCQRQQYAVIRLHEPRRRRQFGSRQREHHRDRHRDQQPQREHSRHGHLDARRGQSHGRPDPGRAEHRRGLKPRRHAHGRQEPDPRQRHHGHRQQRHGGNCRLRAHQERRRQRERARGDQPFDRPAVGGRQRQRGERQQPHEDRRRHARAEQRQHLQRPDGGKSRRPATGGHFQCPC